MTATQDTVGRLRGVLHQTVADLAVARERVAELLRIRDATAGDLILAGCSVAEVAAEAKVSDSLLSRRARKVRPFRETNQ